MPVRPLCPELAEKAQAELNEVPTRIEEDLQHIKDWLAKQPHIRARTDDQWLIAFLRGCKYSLERTKEKLDLYYSLHTLAPEFFRVKPDIFNDVMNLGTYTVLPKTATPTSPVVAIVRPGTYDPDKYAFSDVFSVSLLIQNMLIMESDNMTVAGVQTILDMEGVTMGHFLQFTPSVMKRMAVLSEDQLFEHGIHSSRIFRRMLVEFYQEALPLRMKGTHYLNTPPGFETVFNALKNLLNEKNRSRLYVHNKNYEEMYKYIPKHILPAEYGGDAGTIKEISEYWKRRVLEYSPRLEEEANYGTDESKRPGKPKSAETLFGVEGSFRKLDFD